MPKKQKTQDSMQNNRLKIQSLASQCVKCGICLQSCPTYKISLNENESPRGRIAIMQAIAEQALEPTPTAIKHLSQCLECRTCEKVCPSGVQYGTLFETHQALLFDESTVLTKPMSLPLPLKILNSIIQSPIQLKIVGLSLRLAQISGVRNLLQKTGVVKLLGLAKYDELLPPYIDSKTAYSFRAFYPALTLETRGKVALFIGCITRWVDAKTSLDALYVLNKLGFDVYVPQGQGCCGAIAKHAGDTQTAQNLSKVNESQFANLPISHIISTATGCQVMIQELQADKSNVPVIDICQFILQNTQIDNLQFIVVPKEKKYEDEDEDENGNGNRDVNNDDDVPIIALHTPCTQKNVLKSHDDTLNLLNKFRISVKEVNTGYECCGAAGTYMLRNPDIAQTLKQPILEAMDALNTKHAKSPNTVKLLATSNIGCAMHIASGHKNFTVCHPISLIAQKIFKNTQ